MLRFLRVSFISTPIAIVYETVWHNERVKVRYTYRLRPSKTTAAYLHREAGMCRYVWNQMVARSKQISVTNQQKLVANPNTTNLETFGAAQADKYLTHLRQTAQDPKTGEHWLKQGSSVAQQQTVRDFSTTRNRALSTLNNPKTRRVGFPRFRSRKNTLPTLNYTKRGFTLKPDPNGRLRLALPNKTFIPVVWSRPLPSPPSSVRVYPTHPLDDYGRFLLLALERSPARLLTKK